LNLEEDNVGVVLLGPSTGIKEGSIAKEHNVSLLKWRANGRTCSKHLVFQLMERTNGGDLYEMPLERKAGVIFRQPVTNHYKQDKSSRCYDTSWSDNVNCYW
jgi:F-type H+-transporting ATPase subunit alpha